MSSSAPSDVAAALAAMGSTQWALAALMLIVFGVILLAVELLVIPGFGFVGIAGVAALVGGGVLAWTRLGAAWGIATLALGAGIAIAMLWLLPRTRAGRALVLTEAHTGAVAPAPLGHLAGREGVALTPLRPAGTADLAGERVDVVTDGLFLDAGARIRVVRVEGVRVVVEPVAA